jgi:HPt (histidine-containing phosphotransfer) domain-containing protein
MLGFSSYSSAKSAKADEIEQRLRSIEQRLGGNISARATVVGDHVGEAIASALSAVARRLLGGDNSANIGDANSIREARKMAGEAAQLGNDAMRRVAREIKHRPLVSLAIAIGVGLLMGFVGRRR